MDSVECGRNLISAISDFESEHRDDGKFRDVLMSLSDVRRDVEDLIPDVRRKSQESPGRRDARQVAEESRGRQND